MSDSPYILLVDDNPDDVDLTILALQRSELNFEIVVARDGIDALRMLLGDADSAPTLDTLPRVILLDINMPKLNGFDVLRTLRQHPRTKAQPVVILTSSREEQDIAEGYAHGVNSYIRKPVDYTNFTAAVKHLGLYWMVWNERPVS